MSHQDDPATFVDISLNGDLDAQRSKTSPSGHLVRIPSCITEDTRYTVHGRSAKRNCLVGKDQNGEYIGHRCTGNGLQRILKLHFYFDHDATNVNSVVSKDSKSNKKLVQKGIPEHVCTHG